jgi:DNA-directed RNA polymerase specialized sigma24 family protein
MRRETRDAAYAEFVAARGPMLRRLAHAACGDWERADAVLHAALVRLYLTWPRLEREGTEDAFVRRAVIRSALDPTRHPTGDPTLDALLALPPKQRKVVLLHHGLGLSVDETADELRLSRRTVSTLARRIPDALGDVLAGDEPAHQPVEEHLDAGRRAVRRRRRVALTSSALVLVAVASSPVLFGGSGGGAGGGIDLPTPPPNAADTPTLVHLLVAPPAFVHAGSPPVFYLYGRLFKRSREVEVLATYGEIDVSSGRPQGAAIVRDGGQTTWIALAGNQSRGVVAQRAAPYDYRRFMDWAQQQLPILTRRLAAQPRQAVS